MKKAILYLAKLIIISVTLQSCIAYAADNLQRGDAVSTASLPLSAEQIAKLQHLFPKDNMPSDISSLNATALTPEHIVWQQMPIDIMLPVDKERMVSFPSSIQFGYDKNVLPDDMLRVQNNDGTLYLLAKNTFAPQRVEVKINNTGKIILLNLSAKKEANNIPLKIVMPSATDTALADNAPSSDTQQSTTAPVAESVSYIELTRFAAQQLYAPKRLLLQPPGIFRTPMHTHKTIPLIRTGNVMAMPLASWRSSDRFVTAVLLRNQEKQPVTLDPRALRGQWQAATFFPQTILAPLGTMADSTTVFLVSNRSFADALTECTQGF